MRTEFQADLAEVRGLLVAMADEVRSAMRRATTALLTADAGIAAGVISGDTAVDQLHKEVEEKVYALLARQAPVPPIFASCSPPCTAPPTWSAWVISPSTWRRRPCGATRRPPYRTSSPPSSATWPRWRIGSRARSARCSPVRTPPAPPNSTATTTR